MPNQKFKPGENCPEAGEYQLMNSNGQGTGNYVTMEKGHRFPPTDKEGQYYSK
ncbi:MAG TPA: YjzC family protein [Clostridia bacterium]